MPKMIEITYEDQVVRAFMIFMQIAQAAYKYSDRCFYYDSELTTPVFLALKGLMNSGGVMTHSQLAQWTNTEKHNMTTLVDRMKKNGFVTSEYSKEDRRIANVQITDKGRKVYEEAVPAARKIVERINAWDRKRQC